MALPHWKQEGKWETTQRCWKSSLFPNIPYKLISFSCQERQLTADNPHIWQKTKTTKQTTASIHFINFNLQIWGKGQLEAVMPFSVLLLASMPTGSVAEGLLFVRIMRNSSAAASHKVCKQLLETLPPNNAEEWYPTCEADKCLWMVQRCTVRGRLSPGARQGSSTLPHPSSTTDHVLPHPMPSSNYRWDWKKSVQSSGWSVCQWALFEIYQLLMANFVLHE